MSRPENPLNLFRTYSYHHVLMICDGSTTAEAVAQSGDLSTFEHSNNRFGTRSAGGGKYIILINGMTDAQFSIKTAQWKTTVIPSADQMSSTERREQSTMGTIGIIEPLGVSFLNLLNESLKLLNISAVSSCFALKTIFVGHRDDGSTEVISNVKPFIFIASDITAVFDITGAEYEISTVGIAGGAAALAQMVSTGDNFHFNAYKDDTIGTALGRLEQKLNKRYSDRKQKLVSDAKCQGVTYDIESEFYDVQFKIDVHDSYKNYPTGDNLSSVQSSTGTNDMVITQRGDSSSITELIRAVMESSSQLVDESKQSATSGKKAQYRITNHIESGPEKMNLVYNVQRWEAEIVKSEDLFEFTPPDGEGIEFDYIFTGLNVDVITFDLKMNWGLSFLQNMTTTSTLPLSSSEILNHSITTVNVAGAGNKEGTGDQQLELSVDNLGGTLLSAATNLGNSIGSVFGTGSDQSSWSIPSVSENIGTTGGDSDWDVLRTGSNDASSTTGAAVSGSSSKSVTGSSSDISYNVTDKLKSSLSSLTGEESSSSSGTTVRKKILSTGTSIKDSSLRNRRNLGSTSNYLTELIRYAALENTETRLVIRGNPQILEDTTQLPSCLDPNNSSSCSQQITTSALPSTSNAFTAIHQVPGYVKVNVFMPTDWIAGANSTDYATQFWYKGWYTLLEVEHVFSNGEFTQEMLMYVMHTDDSQSQFGTKDGCGSETAGTSAKSGTGSGSSTGSSSSGDGVQVAEGNTSVDSGTKTLLNEITEGEGTGDAKAQSHGYASGYDVPYGYGAYGNSSKPLSQMTVGEVKSFQRQQIAATKGKIPGTSKGTGAVGKYQVVQGTLSDQQQQLGFSDNDIFDEALQDKIGMNLLNKRGYQSFRNGTMSAHDLQDGIASEWASVADPDTGKSKYGQGTGTTNSEIQQAMQIAKTGGSSSATDTTASSEATDTSQATASTEEATDGDIKSGFVKVKSRKGERWRAAPNVVGTGTPAKSGDVPTENVQTILSQRAEGARTRQSTGPVTASTDGDKTDSLTGELDSLSGNVGGIFDSGGLSSLTSGIGGAISGIGGITSGIGGITSGATNALTSGLGSLTSGVSTALGTVTAAVGTVQSTVNTAKSAVGSVQSLAQSTVQSSVGSVTSGLTSSLNSAASQISSNVSGNLTSMVSSFNIPDLSGVTSLASGVSKVANLKIDLKDPAVWKSVYHGAVASNATTASDQRWSDTTKKA